MLTIDANVWVAAFDPADSFHTIAVSFLRAVASQNLSLFAPDFVKLEVACAVSRRSRDAAAGKAAGGKLMSHPLLTLVAFDHAFQEEALTVGTSAFVRGADALYATTAQRTQSTLITWDDELVRRAGGTTPTDWLVAHA